MCVLHHSVTLFCRRSESVKKTEHKSTARQWALTYTKYVCLYIYIYIHIYIYINIYVAYHFPPPRRRLESMNKTEHKSTARQWALTAGAIRQLRQLCTRTLAADELIPWFHPRDPAGTYISYFLFSINRLCMYLSRVNPRKESSQG